MSNIKRFDPSASTSSLPPPTDGLTDLARKIQERQLKRKAASSLPLPVDSTPTPTPAPSAQAKEVGEWQPAAGESPSEREKREKKEKRARILAEVIPEWKPAAGESPAEREKREKREKRAGKMGGVTFDTGFAPPTGSMYVPPPSEYALPDQSAQFEGAYGTNYDNSTGSTGASSIHPSRMAAAPILGKEKKEKDPNKEKTTAKKLYLKRKRERSKGKKAGEPALPGKRAKKIKRAEGGAEGVGEGDGDGDSDESSVDSDDEREKIEAVEKKKNDILKKKEERKIKRDEKKVEARRVKAEGGVPLAVVPRIVSAKPTPTPIIATPVAMDIDATPAEPTAEELELAVIEAARASRKLAKREKRTARRLPTPEPELSTLIPTAHDEIIRSPTPEIGMESIPQAEPAPLLRLPGATRPAPPSAKTLSALKVHESVRDKMVIDPELKVAFGENGVVLSGRAIKRLGEMGITDAFAVQTAVLPILLPPGAPTALYTPFSPPQDVCVSAPTGSGKTLSYVVPIIETLNNRVVTRLRALILLPTRDLVTQVRETFESFGKGTGLKIGTATGQHSFAHEQVSLVGDSVDPATAGGVSQIDILIATPGRLMDHIRSTPGFSLQHLRYLVIDEADRLLNQSFHDWLPSILAALKPTPSTISAGSSELRTTVAADSLAPDWWDVKIGRVASDVDERCFPSTQKLLFSATLSRDPAKIAALHLHRPIYISVEDALDPNAADQEIDEELNFTLPATLKEHMIVSPSTHKPLYLLHLLHTLELSSALCFTKSVEAATRLSKLVEFFEEARSAEEPEAKKVVVKAYSSDLPSSERTRIFNSFKKGEIQMLICSDLIARGIDLPQVSHVISYDIPSDMRKYVHRVGRTARAGKSGDAWSLVEDQEAAPFKAIMRSAQHFEKISRVRVKDHVVAPFVPAYQIALDRLALHFATGRDKTA